jgi:hypothetical protein
MDNNGHHRGVDFDAYPKGKSLVDKATMEVCKTQEFL